MAEVVDLGNCDGFFKDLYISIEKSCNKKDLRQFAACKTDEERIRFMHNVKAFKDLKYSRVYSAKNDGAAQNFKKEGNLAFQLRQWKLALDFYNKCVLMTPVDNGFANENLSIALANRSAALYHMENYDQALLDIALAEKGYPKHMLYKLKERCARCYLAKKDYEPALKSFRETVTNLDDSKLPIEKRAKLERDAQIMIKMLPRQIEMEKKMKKTSNFVAKTNPSTTEKLHAGVQFNYNEVEGRHGIAKSDIKVGERILVEKPHCTTLLQQFAQTHCQQCSMRTIAPLPCPTCNDVVFCSIQCRTEALASYHQYECGILPILWNSGGSINIHMALRIIAQQPLKYFKDLKEELDRGVTWESTRKLPSTDYRRAFVLVRHEKTRTETSFFQYTLMSSFLAGCLKAAGYFDDALNIDDPDDVHFIGGLLLRNLQFIQFNSHEVFDLVKTRKGNSSKTVFIGGGLYPTLALFNHSCDPSIVRYYKGTTAYVHAIRNIRPGESIGENYGPLYTQNVKIERQNSLKNQYWFDCNCKPCMENWPTYDEMKTDEIRFRCDGGGTKTCNNIISIPAECNEFMIQCIACGHFTNIMKGLKAVQDTELIVKTAKRLLKAGSTEKALAKYIDMMNIIDDVMAPPFQDYCNCQQSIKDCLLEYGNRIEVD